MYHSVEHHKDSFHSPGNCLSTISSCISESEWVEIIRNFHVMKHSDHFDTFRSIITVIIRNIKWTNFEIYSTLNTIYQLIFNPWMWVGYILPVILPINWYLISTLQGGGEVIKWPFLHLQPITSTWNKKIKRNPTPFVGSIIFRLIFTCYRVSFYSNPGRGEYSN